MLRLCFFLITAMLTFAGCSDPAQSSSAGDAPLPEAGEELSRALRINIGGTPETLDPTFIRGSVENLIITGLMEGLLTLDAAGAAIPAAAESWESNENHTVWTFKLRREARWHNGDPVTAEDFVYAAKRIATKSLSAPYAAMVYKFLEGGEAYYAAGGLDSEAEFPGVQALDDYTLQYRLAAPTPFFESVVHLFSWLPVHRATVENHEEDWWRQPGVFIGNGPFRMTGFEGQTRVTAEKAPMYWNADQVWMEQVEWMMIEEESTELAAFENGELDITKGIPIAMLDVWRDRPEYQPFTYFGTYYITFNNEKAPFDDVRVRRAFSQAIDRELIVNRVTRRKEPVSRGLIPAQLPSAQGGVWADHSDDLIGPPNLDGAKQLMAEAGFPEGQGFPETEYLYDNREEHKLIAESLQTAWSQLGVKARIRNAEWGTWLKETRAGNYDIARMSWYGDYMDAMTFLELFTSDSTQNAPQYSNETYDQLIADARKETDPVAREGLLMEAERLLVREDCAIAPLFTYSFPILVSAGIEGVSRDALGGLDYVYARRVKD